jgi:hypothetical protein
MLPPPFFGEHKNPCYSYGLVLVTLGKLEHIFKLQQEGQNNVSFKHKLLSAEMGKLAYTCNNFGLKCALFGFGVHKKL